MPLLNELNEKLDSYVKQVYEIEKTTLVPDADNSKLTFGNKGLSCNFAFLFMDIRKSSQLHEQYGFTKAAKIYQSFHDINVRVIEENNGFVRSFDGDRVMAVFVGNMKNSNAVKAAMQIQWAIRNILNPKFGVKIACGGGIDYGEILVTKVGKGRDKNNNDLVWIGKADNYASHGIVTALISVPLRYMHTKVEMVHARDVEKTIDLIYNIIINLNKDCDFSLLKK